MTCVVLDNAYANIYVSQFVCASRHSPIFDAFLQVCVHCVDSTQTVFGFLACQHMLLDCHIVSSKQTTV
jgi:hypothetical protein